MSWTDEKNLIVGLLVFGVFSLLTLSRDVGIIFLFMTFAYAIDVFGKGSSLPFSQGRLQTLKPAIIGAIGGAAFLFISSYLTSGVFATLDILNLNKATFIAIDEPLVQLIIWGIYIPLVESAFFFGFIYPRIIKYMRAGSFNASSPYTWATIVFIGALASLFHLTVRYSLGTPELTNLALFTDIIFFGISGLLVLKYREWIQAAWMHIIINSVVVGASLGWVFW